MDTFTAYVLAGVLVIYTLLNVVQTEPCRFPAAWQGEWYQSGIGDMIISHNAITRKGVCRDRHRDYYLLENTEEHCHQCLLVLPRHDNILQYKQSYCIGRDSLQSICAQIRVEAILYTLIREPSYPVPCPIKNAFFMTYNNNSGGFCRSPMSFVHQCASSALFHFQFKRCQYSAYTTDQELDFRCLATWKDGSDHFLYGAFTGSHLMNKDDIYRCFIYTILGTVVYMSASADPTCRGLRTPKDGPLVMELTQDVYGWPEAKCRYPRWLLDRDWRDLSGRHHYIVEQGGTAITSSYRTVDNITALQSSYHCLSSKPINDNPLEGFVALVHVLDHCTSHYRCIAVKQSYTDMVELHLGDYVQETDVVCGDDRFKTATVRTLIPTDVQPIKCPYQGRYVSPPDGANCRTEMRSSCNELYSLDIASTCHAKPVLQLECLSWWNYNAQKNILLAKDRTTGLINCLALEDDQGELTLSTEHSCNLGVSSILLHRMTFRFRAFSEPCTTIAPTSANRDLGNRLEGSQDDDPGGGYSHLEAATPPTTRSDLPKQTSNYKQFTSSAPASALSRGSIKHRYIIVVTLLCFITEFVLR